uniref:Uncharacterized protein n=1 Tax=Mesocestoides corti TaxID=53468 RepID=A0A5K3FD77_MESCO
MTHYHHLCQQMLGDLCKAPPLAPVCLAHPTTLPSNFDVATGVQHPLIPKSPSSQMFQALHDPVVELTTNLHRLLSSSSSTPRP